MERIILVLGGARSGKSMFAERLAREMNSRFKPLRDIAYIATATATDDEFRRRIDVHRERRSGIYQTIEEPIGIAAALGGAFSSHGVFLLECITTWLGNLFFQRKDDPIEQVAATMIDDIAVRWGKDPASVNKEDDGFFERLLIAERGDYTYPIKELLKNHSEQDKFLIAVANELGQGIVPADAMTRNYRDIHGRIVQKLADIADYVFYLVAGVPIRLK
ncbi:MAG: bifunctional adenosylcobinamide kinase/adenosylcobinamide-phosphate guanylyltransferase [Spirochaetes bacterium]|nr:bifunctional adenosylcobinamide kinase/adenosylcobinamide-phosphate guanylyltransferase [Spirochaetota bacterium]